jgi:hypothetical protein
MAANRVSEVKPKKCSSNYRWNRSKTQASQKKPSPALRETQSLETKELAK